MRVAVERLIVKVSPTVHTLSRGHRLSVTSQNVLVELQMFGKVVYLTQRLGGTCHHCVDLAFTLAFT